MYGTYAAVERMRQVITEFEKNVQNYRLAEFVP